MRDDNSWLRIYSGLHGQWFFLVSPGGKKDHGIRQDPMAPSDWLCALKMCITQHDIVYLALGSGSHDFQTVYQVDLNLSRSISQPRTHIGCDLFISASSSVKLSSSVLATNLVQSSFICSVNNSSNPERIWMCQQPIILQPAWDWTQLQKTYW